MKHLLALIFILACSVCAFGQGPGGGAGPGPNAVAVQFVDSAPSVCPLNRLIIVRATGVAYMNILGSCTKVFNTAVSLPASASQGDLLYGSAANTYSNLAKDTNATRYLANTGTSNNPAWAQVALATGVSGTLPVANGGTGQTSAANAINALLPAQGSNSGKYLTTNGTVSSWGIVSAGVTCSGCTTDTLPKTTGAGALGNSRITDDGTNIALAAFFQTAGTETDINQVGGTVIIGDSQGDGNSTKLIVDDGNQQISVTKPLSPQSAGGTTLGTSALPFSSTYIGNAATNNIQLTGTATAPRAATLPDATGTVLLDSTSAKTLVCSNTAASTAITGTATKTYFNINCSIPANTLSAGKTITLDARGVYSAAAANTIVQAVDLCKVSGCGSGTVVNLATTSAATPGLVTNQGWLLNENHVVYTAGATGTMDTQGYSAYQTAALVITFDPTQNTSTATIDTTAQQYLSIAVTWSSNSGTNTITIRNFKVIIQ